MTNFIKNGLIKLYFFTLPTYVQTAIYRLIIVIITILVIL